MTTEKEIELLEKKLKLLKEIYELEQKLETNKRAEYIPYPVYPYCPTYPKEEPIYTSATYTAQDGTNTFTFWSYQ